MQKGVIIGIIISGIVIGIIAGFSLGALSGLDDETSPISQIEDEKEENVSKPQGRDLSIEFDEKMGLSAP